MNEALKAKLRKVFLLESGEDYISLRKQWDLLKSEMPTPACASHEAFFKATHKLKGACRAVGLKAAETIGFQIEYLFRRHSENPSIISNEEVSDVDAAIVQLGDFLKAYSEGDDPAIPLELAHRLNEHMQTAGCSKLAELPQPPPKNTEPPKTASKKSIHPRLLAAFKAESVELLENLRAALKRAKSPKDATDWKEAVYSALHAMHTLKGSSHVVEMQELSAVAHKAETLLQDPKMDQIESGSPLLQELDRYATQAEALILGQSATTKAQETKGAPSEASSSPTEQALKDNEEITSFRIESQRFDGLVENFSDLQILRPDLEEATLALEATKQSILRLESEERDLSHRIGPELHHPSYAKVAGYVNHLSRNIRQLSKSVDRQARTLKRIQSNFDLRVTSIDNAMSSVQFTPIGEVITGLRPMVQQLATQQEKNVDFEIEGISVQADRFVLQQLRGPLIHILRNAIDHGIESTKERAQSGKSPSARLLLSCEIISDTLRLTIQDDGRGIDTDIVGRKAIELGIHDQDSLSALSRNDLLALILSPRLSTRSNVSQVSGRGMGLSSVAEDIREMDGHIQIHSEYGKGTRFEITLPIKRSTSHVMVIRCGELTLGILSKYIFKALRIHSETITEVNGVRGIYYEEHFIELMTLNSALGLPDEDTSILSMLILECEGYRKALQIPNILGEEQTVLRKLPPTAASQDLFSNGFLTSGGGVALVLDTAKLLGSNFTTHSTHFEPISEKTTSEDPSENLILVVDDSFTSRTLEMGVLEAQGYRVHGAYDGVDALHKLRTEKYDLIISDIEMPRMNGFELLKAIKEEPKWQNIPVIMISSLEDESIIRKGLTLGADSYIVKKRFEHDELIDTLRSFL